jgi:hypothetical protein
MKLKVLAFIMVSALQSTGSASVVTIQYQATGTVVAVPETFSMALLVLFTCTFSWFLARRRATHTRTNV